MLTGSSLITQSSLIYVFIFFFYCIASELVNIIYNEELNTKLNLLGGFHFGITCL